MIFRNSRENYNSNLPNWYKTKNGRFIIKRSKHQQTHEYKYTNINIFLYEIKKFLGEYNRFNHTINKNKRNHSIKCNVSPDLYVSE